MDDLSRLRAEYADRARRLAGSDIYSYFNVANLFIIQQRQRVVLRLLRNSGFYPLESRKILEVGCGQGGELLEILSFGASTHHLHGADLLFDRVHSAHRNISNLLLTDADGQNLPYTAHSFDLTMQFTVFSSILDCEVKANMASELLRVTRPGGMILWYDFWLNPTNPQTRGVRPAEIRQLFPNCHYEFHRITLAPPLVRKLVSISWGLCLFLESLKIFNTHYLVAIRPRY
jgi:ubiquinone/menaquinone biosynthesis C-methylase UbiE